jgi:peptidoglycan/LPS O-acetylase OafA/YrhL
MTNAETSPAAVQGRSIHFIQLLRGIGALLVMWWHLSGYWLLTNHETWGPETFWYNWVTVPFHLFANGGHLGVILFFLVSGYIITHVSQRESHTQFGVKRVFRILPPLALAVAVALAIESGLHLHVGILPGHNSHHGIIAYLKNALLVNWIVGSGSNYLLAVTWTLVIEAMFYLVTFALLTYSHRNALGATWAMLGIWVGFNMLFLSSPSLRHIEDFVVYVAFLIFGRALYLVNLQKIALGEGVLLCAATGLCFILFYTVTPAGIQSPEWPGPLLSSQTEPAATYVIAVIAFIVLMRVRMRRVVQPFKFFGDISYSLYLLHLPVGLLIIDRLHRAGTPFTLCFIAAVAGSIAAAYVSYRVIEVPFQRLARRLLEPAAHLEH